MKKTPLIIAIVLMIQWPVAAEEYSLSQCVRHAKQYNGNVKIASLNAEISEKQVNQKIGDALPKIDFSGTLTDNVEITTTLLPGEFLGMPSGTFIPVKMGTQYNSSIGARLTQTIFDPSIWVGLKAAKLSEQLSRQKIQQTDEDLCYGISVAYCQAFIIQRKLVNLNGMLSASQQTLMSMELKFKNGIVKKIDVDKIRVSYNNTRSQVEQTVLNLKQALNNLKYLMGLPMGNDISLSDSLSEGVWEQPDETIQKDDVVEHRIDYQMLKTNVAAQNLNKQNQMAAYFPTLTFSANYNYQAMRTRFDIFEKGKEWYKNSSIGLNLSIPIFSGFKRVSKVSEAQLGIEVAKENLKLSAQAIQLEISNYGVQYSTALDNIQNEKDNLSLAENVLKNIRLEFSQGTGSSIDLIQAESAFRETQNNYYTKLLTLYLAKLDLEKSQGTLTQFINKLR